MNCIVTGACGFIGINLCKRLLEDGHDVTGIDNFIVGQPEELLKVCGDFHRFQMLEGDFASKYHDSVFYEGADVIYHLGGMSGVRESIDDPQLWFRNNVIGTFNVLELARKHNIKKVVVASSSASIGDVDPPIHEEIPMKPISPYGASKGFKELFSTAYYHSYGIDAVSLRFSNVYGPHSTIKASLVAKFIRKIMNKETIEIYGSGKQTRDFIYVDDLVEAIILSGEKNVGGQVFQISTGVETTVNDMTKLICKNMKQVGHIAKEIRYTEPALGDILTNYADNSKAVKMLNWTPKVGIEEGVRETIKWFISEVNNGNINIRL